MKKICIIILCVSIMTWGMEKPESQVDKEQTDIEKSLVSPIDKLFGMLRDVDRSKTSGHTRTLFAVWQCVKGLSRDEVMAPEQDETKNTLLHYLADMPWGHFAKYMAKQVLLKGAHVDAVNAYGQTPLLVAIRAGHVDFARFLYENKASVGYIDPEGYTALHELTSNNKFIIQMNYAIHECKKTFDVAGCQDEVLNCFTLLTEPRLPSFDEAMLSHFIQMPYEDLKAAMSKLPIEQRITIFVTRALQQIKPNPGHEKGLLAEIPREAWSTIAQDLKEEKIYKHLAINSHEKNGGNTSLHLAAEHGASLEILTRLVELGAARMIRNKDRKRPYQVFNSFSCLCSACVQDEKVVEAIALLRYPRDIRGYIKQRLWV